MSPEGAPLELKFPVSWKFRIIVETAAVAAAEAALREVFQRWGLTPELTSGAGSRSGTYRTLATSELEIVSRAQLEGLARDLAAVPGVRVVL